MCEGKRRKRSNEEGMAEEVEEKEPRIEEEREERKLRMKRE